LLSPRWRWLVYALFIVSGLCLIAAAFETPMLINSEPNHPVANPLGGQLAPLQPYFQMILNLSVGVYLALFAGGLGEVVVRFRRTRGAEREQIKWFAYAAAFSLFMIFTGGGPQSLFGSWSQGIVNLALNSIPAAIAIAILKYRLYDIDIIVRRTLIYSVLTAILALVYFASVVLLQQFFRAISGQSSDIAIIVSTLAIAALFVPLRRRVQQLIDRRFYRRKYDAQLVLEHFAVTARDEVELEKLTGELLNVVSETMQPAQVSLWLRKTEGRVK
ncbi:MAG TPA: hypothetical protein VF478_03545, partial [Anaerolineae bacterium]